MNDQKKTKLSRRDFVAKSAVTLGGISILPSTVIAGLGHKAPSDKLNIAGVGVGGRGLSVLNAMNKENIVGLCDVDWHYSEKAFKTYPKAKRYKDFRKMLDEMKDIDAVMVATPDHTHALVAATAMMMGKHVYVEKPLTLSVSEARVLTNMAKEYKVATQMGNQGNSGEGVRSICEWIWSGKIGEVKEVKAWTNRPIWPQGLERPKGTPQPPSTLDWDLFLGPAKYRPYNPIYTPWNWRAWWDFGTGALGDMGCHILDPVVQALRLKYATSVEASSTQLNTESAPLASTIHFEFPKREKFGKVKMPELKVTWTDGGILPERPAEMLESERFDPSGGVIFEGTKGKIVCGCYGKNPMLLPSSEMDKFKRPKQTLRRIDQGHYMDWVRACKEDPSSRVEASSNFENAGPLTEMVLMGNLGLRLQSLKKKLLWDGDNMRFTNISDSEQIKVVTSDHFEVVNGHPIFDTKYATQNALEAAAGYVKPKYRKGWEIKPFA
ncbi:dehydrogenase (plasmid) [Fulvitalea axinellae]|uniref:Dehydrogenase n=1 Tax=Fulvitalea axinellae TaxID=1182444 RepID=A0AAU9CWZ2_9BACT|nr:dehydrogenase [Fulvitalea axinellae]